MDPLEYVRAVSERVAHAPVLALAVAFLAGLLSTAT